MAKKKACPHTSRMFVPHEDDPNTLVDLCLLCHRVMGTTGPGDPELEAIGDSLGDPEGDEWDDFYEWDD
jgi:hypothetical protein